MGGEGDGPVPASPLPPSVLVGDSELWEALGKRWLKAWSLIMCPRDQMFQDGGKWKWGFQ